MNIIRFLFYSPSSCWWCFKVHLLVLRSLSCYCLLCLLCLLAHEFPRWGLINVPNPTRRVFAQAWLGQTGGGLWSTPQSFYSEECPSPLEVLSELGPAPPPTAPGRKEEDGDAVRGLDEGEPSESGAPAPVERWTAAPHDPWLMDRLRELHRNQKSSPLESQDAYVTLSGDNHGDEGGHPDAALEEASPLEVLFARGKTASCESHSDLGSAPRSSGLGGLSSQSSFEDPNQRKEPGYTYMAVADSGVSMDYSPMSRGDDIGIVAISANEYENQIPGLRRPFRPSQHPDG